MSEQFRPISHLRHVALAVPEYDSAVEFYRNLWCLDRVADDTDISFWGTPADTEQYMLRLRKDAKKGIDLLAFAAHSAAHVDELAERLHTAGVTVDREPGSLDTPGGGYGLRFFDPCGVLLEVSADVAGKTATPLEERESTPRKLSHVVINSPDLAASKVFYEEHLGLRLSDWLGDVMCFMRSGTQHHILGIGRGTHTSLNHASFELRGVEEYLRGTGRLMRAGHDPLWGPGRHGPGDNTFSYFLDPNRNVMEYTTELESITDDDTWEPRTFGLSPESQDQWGTAGGMTEQMLAAQANDPDQVLWTTSPV